MLRNAADRQIVSVAVPAFVALVTEPLMLLADTAIIGHLGTPELGGLAAASVVLGTVVGLCVFLAYGSTATVARHHRAGDERAAYGLAISSLWLAVGLGTVLGAVVAGTSAVLANTLSSSSQVAGHAQDYLVVSALGVPLVVRTLTLRATVVLAALVAADLGAGDAGGTRALTARMIGWGAGTGLVALVVLAVLAPWLPHLFTSDRAVREALVPALLVVAAIQPLSGVVFVLDGVLIGAGDGVYLALAGLITLGVYTPLVLLVGATDAGFTWLWVAYGGFIGARLVTLWLRQRGDTWMVLGATRSAD